MATMYLSEANAPYRMEIRPLKDGSRLWAYFYKKRKLVWNCNDGFAKEHFVSVPNNQGHGLSPVPKTSTSNPASHG
jgi:hypothetical protein